MAKNVIDRDLVLKRIMRELQSAKNAFVDIGVHEGERNSEGLNIAEYGAYNEFGTSKIPERSFMRSTFDEKQSKIKADMDNQFALLIEGKNTAYRSLAYVGERHQQDIQAKIKSGIDPANAGSTIASKGSSKTLIDTGSLVQSIRYVVHK